MVMTHSFIDLLWDLFFSFLNLCSLSLSILLDDDDDDQLIIMCSSSRVVLVILIHSNHHDSCVCVFVVFFVCMYSWKKVNTIHTLSLALSLSVYGVRT